MLAIMESVNTSQRILNKEFLRKIGVTQTRLAEAAGISQPNLNDYLQGKSTPTVGLARDLADALGIPITELIFPAELTRKPKKIKKLPAQ